MLMMITHTLPPMTWKIRSVSVRSREGSHRLAEVYRLLLKQHDGSGLACHASQGTACTTTDERSGNDARCHLCSSLN
jgi:hypothetical protein